MLRVSAVRKLPLTALLRLENQKIWFDQLQMPVFPH